MRTWLLAVAGCACLAAGGCRTDPEVAYLQRDNRRKEDEIYRLRERVADLEEAVQSCAPAAVRTVPAAPREAEQGPHLAPAGGGSSPGASSRDAEKPKTTKPRSTGEKRTSPPDAPIRIELPPPPTTELPGEGVKEPPEHLKTPRRVKPPDASSQESEDRAAGWTPREAGPIADAAEPVPRVWQLTPIPTQALPREATRLEEPVARRPSWSPERR
jgi:hypothetical protein